MLVTMPINGSPERSSSPESNSNFLNEFVGIGCGFVMGASTSRDREASRLAQKLIDAIHDEPTPEATAQKAFYFLYTSGVYRQIVNLYAWLHPGTDLIANLGPLEERVVAEIISEQGLKKEQERNADLRIIAGRVLGVVTMTAEKPGGIHPFGEISPTTPTDEIEDPEKVIRLAIEAGYSTAVKNCIKGGPAEETVATWIQEWAERKKAVG